jgi:hypothetical protein
LFLLQGSDLLYKGDGGIIGAQIERRGDVGPVSGLLGGICLTGRFVCCVRNQGSGFRSVGSLFLSPDYQWAIFFPIDPKTTLGNQLPWARWRSSNRLNRVTGLLERLLGAKPDSL